jgi:hypothetical protein
MSVVLGRPVVVADLAELVPLDNAISVLGDRMLRGGRGVGTAGPRPVAAKTRCSSPWFALRAGPR